MYNHECIIIVKKGIYFDTLNVRFHDATFILEIDNKSNGKINRTNLVELITNHFALYNVKFSAELSRSITEFFE